MHIAYLTSIYPRASDTFIRIEVQQLRRLGFEVDTFSVRRSGDEAMVNDDIRREARQTAYLLDGTGKLLSAVAWAIFSRPSRFLAAVRTVFTTHAPGVKNRVKQLAYACEAAALAKSIRERGIEHVHNHIGENSATVAMLAADIADVPYSMTIHGPGIFFHPQQWALGEKITRSQFTACISHFCRSQCMIFTPQRAWSKLKLVRCAVGDAFMDVTPEPIPASPHFVFVGRLAEVKGVPLLIEATHQLNEQGIRIELALVGDGPLRAWIQQRIAELNLVDQIELMGWQDSDEVRRQIELSRGLVHASFAEGLPVVMMEALALGRPVITTRIAAVSELVEHDRSGWLIDASDVDGLVAALRTAAEASPQQLADMGRAGRDAVLERHDIRKEAAKLAELFEGAINGNNLSLADGAKESRRGTKPPATEEVRA